MRFNKLIVDVSAGLTVSFAAISLGAAFGVMSGRGAFAGMVAAAVIPIIASIFGGTRIQASGPTAPMTAVSSLVIAFAYDRFHDKMLAEQFITLVFILNAGVLILAGLFRLGKLIRFVPNVVILGFMNGIAVLIWYDQAKKLFATGDNPVMQGGILSNVLITLATLGIIYGIVWIIKKYKVPHRIKIFLPGVLLSIIVMSVVVGVSGLSVETVQLGASIDSLSDWFALIASYLPKEILQAEYVLMALPYALELALLAYLDSLLTALVVDRMTKEQSKQNKELMAQGLANAGSALMQGIPGAQATIRSVLLIKEGAQTRLAGVLIGVFGLLFIGVFKDYLAMIPAAVFIGVLFKAGIDVADKDFLLAYMNNSWFGSRKRNIQFLFILGTTVVTVLVDLNTAVISGTILFYIARYFWQISDVEPDFEQVSEREAAMATG